MAVGDDLKSPYPRFSNDSIKVLERQGPTGGFGTFIRDYVDRRGVVCGQPKVGWVPAMGDLVVIDATLNYGFDLAAAGETPAGRVVGLRSPTDFDVRLFIKGTVERLAYVTGSAPVRGNAVVIGATPNRVVAGAGTSIVLGVDVSPGTCDVAF